ncbi:hypothetical protein EDEG_02489 [Edhazardia aedis USNM 41457]|uniref:Uncharacterized protein n=1 Tax=Edhazardia aedis (strain USNM 41457) TaxID=1003232 RepID=J9DKL8_EDHAE|nr:hypothetical protein EDEG_02489 [Edhazardia aedis USNM 41457]|eukprot:EJW03130.1 hypothetical protein EDEG_02489 [Edhazardia aedis USNM 41457]
MFNRLRSSINNNNNSNNFNNSGNKNREKGSYFNDMQNYNLNIYIIANCFSVLEFYFKDGHIPVLQDNFSLCIFFIISLRKFMLLDTILDEVKFQHLCCLKFFCHVISSIFYKIEKNTL